LLVDLRNNKKATRNTLSFQDNIKTRGWDFSATTNWYPDSLMISGEEIPQTQTVTDNIQETFLQPVSTRSSPIEITPLLKAASSYEWMTTTLLLLMAIMVVLWFVMPKRQSLFQQIKQSLKSPSEITLRIPGFLFSVFFYLNYLVVVVLFIIISIEKFVHPETSTISLSQLIVLTSLAFVVYSLYKLAFIAVAGFLFNTRTLAMQQIRLYINLDNISGFLLLPVLLVFLSTQSTYFFYFGVLIILIANAIKWFQTIALGKSVSMFKLYHLIIYLCTLEIIPFILLIKLIKNLGI